MAETPHKNGNGSIRDQIYTACAVMGLVVAVGGPWVKNVTSSLEQKIQHERELRERDVAYAALDRVRIEDAAASQADLMKLHERVGQKFVEVETQIDSGEQRSNASWDNNMRLHNITRRDMGLEPYDPMHYFSSIATRKDAETNGK